MVKPVPLPVWANKLRGDYPPSMKTVYRWIAQGRIYPRPEKIGRDYFVLETARYVDPRDPDFMNKVAEAIHESTTQ